MTLVLTLLGHVKETKLTWHLLCSAKLRSKVPSKNTLHTNKNEESHRDLLFWGIFFDQNPTVRLKNRGQSVPLPIAWGHLGSHYKRDTPSKIIQSTFAK